MEIIIKAVEQGEKGFHISSNQSMILVPVSHERAMLDVVSHIWREYKNRKASERKLKERLHDNTIRREHLTDAQDLPQDSNT